MGRNRETNGNKFSKSEEISSTECWYAHLLIWLIILTIYLGGDYFTISKDLLMKYNWPGNVRELENVLERTINLMDDETTIYPEHLPPILKKTTMALSAEASPAVFDLEMIVNQAEQQAIKRALDASGGNKTKAAKILGVHRSAFYQKMRKYDMDIESPS